jgi:uncharacterized membrane protein
MIPFDATRPWLLLALLATVPVLLLARRSKLRLSRARFWTSFSCRLAAVAALALALGGARFVRTSDELAVVFVLDRSRSIPAEDGRAALDWIVETAKSAGPRESVGLVVFGRDASVEATPGPKLDVDRVHSVIAPEGTDLERALRLATAACPESAQKRIVLVSDGNETSGDAAAEAPALRARGVEVWTAVLGRESEGEIRIERVIAPARVSPKEPYEVTAIVASTHDAEATFRVLKNRTPLEPVKRRVKKGTWPVTFALKAREDEAGMSLDFDVRLEVPEETDGWRENNAGLAHTRVTGPSRVLYVEGSLGEEDALAGCLRDAGIDVEVRGPAGMPLSLAEMDAFDAILMTDIHSRQLSRSQQQALRQYVHDLGGGFLMIGGPSSFGAGGWQRTTVEEMLPVWCDVRQMQHKASLAVVVIIDSSGSMSATVADGRTKLALAGEAASEVVRLLNPSDEIAVATVDTEPHWVVNLDTQANWNDLQDDVLRLNPGGGGILCATGLKAGFEEMKKATCQMRHLILFADAADAEEHEGCEKLVDDAVASGITMSVVALGRPTDQDAAWLEALAERGTGRYHITDDALDLPRIFSEETVAAARSVIIEGEFQPAFVRHATLLEGVDWKAAPPLLGYVSSVPKDTAEVHLEALDTDPLLAKWHYGLGRSAAFLSDAKPRWARHWMTWPGYRTMWPQLVRWLLRRPDSGTLTVAATPASGVIRLSVDAVAATGKFRDFLKLKAFVAGPAGSAEAVLRQTGPGLYEGEIPADGSGTWFITVAEAEGDGWEPRAGIPVIIPYPAEYRFDAPNRALLQRLADTTGGRSESMTALPDLFKHTAAPARIPKELYVWFLAVALAALLVDVAARRLGIPQSWRLRRAVAAGPAAVEGAIGRLKGAKAQAVPKYEAVEPPPEAPRPAPAKPAAPEGAPKPADDAGGAGYLDRLKEAKKRAQR